MKNKSNPLFIQKKFDHNEYNLLISTPITVIILSLIFTLLTFQKNPEPIKILIIFFFGIFIFELLTIIIYEISSFYKIKIFKKNIEIRRFPIYINIKKINIKKIKEIKKYRHFIYGTKSDHFFKYIFFLNNGKKFKIIIEKKELHNFENALLLTNKFQFQNDISNYMEDLNTFYLGKITLKK